MKRRFLVRPEEAGIGLLIYLRDRCPEAPSVKAIKRAIDGRACMVNGKAEWFSTYPVRRGDRIELDLTSCYAERKPLLVLYEDEQLLVVDKPSGMVSDDRDVSRLLPGNVLVNRLDKGTSGVLLLARSPQVKEQMKELFLKLLVRKSYLAVVDGAVTEEGGEIDNFLGAKPQLIGGQTVYGRMKNGRRAITRWTCIGRNRNASLVSCQPITGRTHQLRVHFSEMGHPILGDTQYGKQFVCGFVPPRLLLHSQSIAFPHPVTGHEVAVSAPLPEEFEAAAVSLNFLQLLA